VTLVTLVSAPGLTVRTFAKRRGAESFVGQFEYARRVCRLEPLIVRQHGIEWQVVNPDYDADAWTLDARGCVIRRGADR
jgi:hypothetical protein